MRKSIQHGSFVQQPIKVRCLIDVIFLFNLCRFIIIYADLYCECEFLFNYIFITFCLLSKGCFFLCVLQILNQDLHIKHAVPNFRYFLSFFSFPFSLSVSLSFIFPFVSLLFIFKNLTLPRILIS